jgi:hypothetical protein
VIAVNPDGMPVNLAVEGQLPGPGCRYFVLAHLKK